MAENTINVKVKQRTDTESNWASKNPVLLKGEMAISSDKNNKYKIGDGTSVWSALSYAKADLSKSDVTTALGYTPPTTNTTYNDVTQSTHGLMTATDKKKLDGIASGATKVTDSTVAGWGYKKTDTNTWRPLGTTADTACAGNDSRLSNARPANGGTADTSKMSAKLQTYKSGSTTETYGTNYPVYAQWSSDNSKVNLKCDNYKIATDYATSAGAANSAVKLATARTVSNTEDFVMSFSYDGSANSNANLRYYNSCIHIGNTNNYPYHRFAKIDTQTSSYTDKTSTFLITQDYNDGGWGIVRISLRTNNSFSVSTVEAKWLVRCGLNVDCVQIGLYNVFGKTYADAFFKTSGTYAGTVIRNLASGARGNIDRTWTLIDSTEADNTTTSDKKTSTESYTSTSTAATTLHSQAYTSVVVAKDGGTVSYANSAGSVAWNNISGKPSTYTPSSHTHDDRYYTESEINSKLSGKASSSHTHTKSQITDFPTSMPASGGNSSTVNGHTVNSNVPANAKFTDTTYAIATTSANGLMSKDMVTKLNGIASGATAVTSTTVSNWGFKKTDTNTWRGVQNNLTSTATDQSLSAYQGKVLKDLVDKKTTFTYSSTQPTSPASNAVWIG